MLFIFAYLLVLYNAYLSEVTKRVLKENRELKSRLGRDPENNRYLFELGTAEVIKELLRKKTRNVCDYNSKIH